MFSNYRVIQYTQESGEVYFQIHQVVYDKDGIPTQLTEVAKPQSADTETLKNLLVHQLSALTMPALDSKIFMKDNSAQTAVDILKGEQNV